MKTRRKRSRSITQKELFKQEEIRFKEGVELEKQAQAPLIQFYRDIHARNKTALREYGNFLKSNSPAILGRQRVNYPAVLFPLRAPGTPDPPAEPLSRYPDRYYPRKYGQFGANIVRTTKPLEFRGAYDYVKKGQVPPGVAAEGYYLLGGTGRTNTDPDAPPVPPSPLPEKQEGHMGFHCQLEGHRVVRFVESLGFYYTANSNGYTDVVAEVSTLANSAEIICPEGACTFTVKLKVRIQNGNTIAGKLFGSPVGTYNLSSVDVLRGGFVGAWDEIVHNDYAELPNLVGAFHRIAGTQYTIWFDLVFQAHLQGDTTHLFMTTVSMLDPWKIVISEQP